MREFICLKGVHMKIPNVKLSDASLTAVQRILNESKKPHTIEEQMLMANYYAHLHSRGGTDVIDYAKILLGK